MDKNYLNFKKCRILFLTAVLLFNLNAFGQTVEIYNESFGNPSSNTSVNSYTGYDNTNVIYSDNSTNVDVRNTDASQPSQYSFASEGGNVFLGSSASGEKTFQIANIDISGASDLQLKFGLKKNTNNSDGSELSISAIVDNGAPISLVFNLLPTGKGSAIWYEVIITNMSDVPTGSFLTLIFNKTNSTTQMRLDDIILSKTNDPTPVTLSSFQATYMKGLVQLVWKTSTELNTAYFAVERSLDGKSFKEVGKVTAKNTRNGAVYKFDDLQSPMASKIYYRLKMVDIDQKYEYSSVASVWMNDGKKGNIQLQGNIVKEQLVLSMNESAEGMMSYQIIDLNGRIFESNQWTKNGNQNVEINVSNLNAGLYILKVIGNNQQETFKFVKK